MNGAVVLLVEKWTFPEITVIELREQYCLECPYASQKLYFYPRNWWIQAKPCKTPLNHQSLQSGHCSHLRSARRVSAKSRQVYWVAKLKNKIYYSKNNFFTCPESNDGTLYILKTIFQLVHSSMMVRLASLKSAFRILESNVQLVNSYKTMKYQVF